MKVFNGSRQLDDVVGEHLGYSGWHQVPQQRIDDFAAATGDHQWIHTDRERAASGPFGSTIAHGYLTLSLVAPLGAEIYRIDDVDLIINYGVDSVRFLTPVRVGSWVRAGAEVIAVKPVEGGRRLTLRFTVEIRDVDKPALVADTVLLVIDESSKE